MSQWQWIWDNLLTWLALAVLAAWGRTHTMVTQLRSEVDNLKESVARNSSALSSQGENSSKDLAALNMDLKEDLDRMRSDIEYLQRTSINGEELERHLINLNNMVNSAVETTRQMNKDL